MLGNLVVKLGLNSKGFTKGLDQSQSRLGMFTKSVTGGIAKVAALAAGAVSIGSLGFGLSLVAEAEQAEVAFTTMLGSVDLAKQKLGELKQFAASTPFQLGELRDSARQLLAFGVSADDLIPTMKTLGDLSAGTQKPIADFVDIFGKVKASGVASMGDINRLADRGVPVFQELAKVMGVSSEEVRGLVGSGKVGFTELKQVMENVVGAGGLFEDSMKKQSGTMSGLWSTLKDNVLFVIEDIAKALVDGFDIKGLLGDGILSVQSLKESIAGILPLVNQWARTMAAFVGYQFNQFKALGSMISGVFTSMGEMAGIQFGSLTETAMAALVAIEYGYKNWEKIAGIVVTGAMLGIVQLFGKITHFFTGVIPALLSGFSDNWTNTFYTGIDYVLTLFINLGENIRSIMKATWDYVSSGGEKAFAPDLKKLSQGFHNSMKAIEIPERIKSDFEKSLESQFKNLKDEVQGEYKDLLKERMALFDMGSKKKEEQDKKRKKEQTEEQKSLGTMGSTSGPVGAALKGTSSAISSILSNVNGGSNLQAKMLKKSEEQLKESQKQTKEIKKTNMALKSGSGTVLVGRAIA